MRSPALPSRLNRLVACDGTILGYFTADSGQNAHERAARADYPGSRTVTTDVCEREPETVRPGDPDRVEYCRLDVWGELGSARVGWLTSQWLRAGAESVEARRFELDRYRRHDGSVGGRREAGIVVYRLVVRAMAPSLACSAPLDVGTDLSFGVEVLS